jgi:pimeloyl-ACP methyl ester carboxylesterase
MLTRRELVRSALAVGVFGLVSDVLSGCTAEDLRQLQETTPGWFASILAPVFYGWHDFGPTDGAPTDLRVWYPSLDGTPQDARVAVAGHFPLVLFLHGQCAGVTDQYQTWFVLPAQLARSGYVVAVPDLGPEPAAPWENTSALTSALKTLQWMRSAWPIRHVLAPETAVVGHSFGALLGAKTVANGDPGYAVPTPAPTVPPGPPTPAFSAFVGLAGPWANWAGVEQLPSLTAPTLLLFGDNDILAPFTNAMWDRILPSTPKYRLRFTSAEHWDMWRSPASSSIACDSAGPGLCNLTGGLVADFTTIFVSKYMPPPAAGVQPGRIPDDFAFSEPRRSRAQQFYVGGYVGSIPRLAANPQCGATLESSLFSGSKTTF